jgi:hypothetical protein
MYPARLLRPCVWVIEAEMDEEAAEFEASTEFIRITDEH